ncbi:MAG: CBS domain-containing protein [Acidimicrobiia bacterium]
MSQTVPPRSGPTIDEPRGESVAVVWTRGQQCRSLAQVLGGPHASQVGSDLVASCIEARADMLVTRRLTSFNLCSLVVPHGFAPSTTTSVVAAVGNGPHSLFAAVVAQRLSTQLGVPSRAIYGYEYDSEYPQALDTLDSIAGEVPGLETAPIRAPSPAEMVEDLTEGTLLVVGAPGGSWFQRQFFGPGVRIQAKAPNGAIVVRHAPKCVYQVMEDPVAFGPHMGAADAAQLADGQPIIVAEHGKLLGLVPRPVLLEAGATQKLEAIMGEPVFLYADESLDHARDLVRHRDGVAIPVLDSQELIIGAVTADVLQSG